MKYTKKNKTNTSLTKKVKKIEKEVKQLKPETKQIELSYNNQVISFTGGSSYPAVKPGKGTNSNQRVGDKIKLTSYYGVFYFSLAELSPDSNNSIRLIHALTNVNLSENQAIPNNGGTQMKFNQLPQDNGFMILEDKLITLSTNGQRVRRLVIKKKFKYPINLKFDTSNEYIDWVPILYLTSDSAAAQHPIVNGQLRYYYTDV